MNGRHVIGLATLALVVAAGLPSTAPARAGSVAPLFINRSVYLATFDGTVFQSSDGKPDWTESDTGLPQSLNTLVVAPDGNTLYAGTEDGVYVAANGGSTWSDDNGDSPDLRNANIVGLVINPAHSRDLYALSSDGTLFATGDGGAHWDSTALPAISNGGKMTTLAEDPWYPPLLIAGADDGSILRSTDYGADWQDTDGTIGGGAVNGLTFNPLSTDVAYAATGTGIYQTLDGGKSWQPDQRGMPDNTGLQSVAVDPSEPTLVLAGTMDGRFYRSQNGGTSWSHQGGIRDSGSTDPVYAIVFYPAHPGVVLAASEEEDTLYRSSDNGGHWSGHDTILDSVPELRILATAPGETLPTDPVAAPSGGAQDVRYFPQTQHTVSGAFLAVYNADNGLKIFGLPLTEAFIDKGQTVQYFERSRLVTSQGRISITPLGSQLTAGRNFQPVGAGSSSSGSQYFPQTHHTLSGMFLTFWQSHQGIVMLGYPISQPLKEQNGDGTGRTYLVQYFQNARLEYHPELSGTGNQITLGLLGKEALQQRGWL